MPLSVTGLYIYPIKSCRGIALSQVTLNRWGLAYDRHWMLVDASGQFISQRQHPRLALVETALEEDCLRLNAPGQPELRLSLNDRSGLKVEVVVWRDRCRALDQGDVAAQWFQQVLGLPCRLVRMTEDFDREVDPRYAPPGYQVNFADGYPVLMISEASLADLNGRLTVPLPMNRFRPNLVVTGCEPYAEDTWRRVRIGAIEFLGVKLCGRCVITTTDQERGERQGQDPLETLAAYRQVGGRILFGQKLVYSKSGQLVLGDRIEVLELQTQQNV
ncbi:MOSC domain-containing protein [Leptolyngbya sp. 'hensonii']|uniref:MOSC domain-containing protein n=1 Tax=Leptolyngbya sp. 'hensonii' TaxID=1922337 RepID=UPI0009500C70|nr:MOSC N-terminal beta barrel domain-containing protein [Leptolyngbya sp. 'hensonii']OLP19575.1 MOSC domain-containing protein [Leptolyngbya sp. 'hensonii']